MFNKRKISIAAFTAAITLALAVASANAAPAPNSMGDMGGRPLTAVLSGASEVPPNASTATGSASVWLNPGQSRVCYAVTVEGLTGTLSGAHIHIGAAGVNGPVKVPLAIPDLAGCADVDPELIKAIRQNPGNYYINVHTSAFPGGEIRGQLTK